jgi:hypothetical protein
MLVKKNVLMQNWLKSGKFHYRECRNIIICWLKSGKFHYRECRNIIICWLKSGKFHYRECRNISVYVQLRGELCYYKHFLLFSACLTCWLYFCNITAVVTFLHENSNQFLCRWSLTSEVRHKLINIHIMFLCIFILPF